MAGNKVFIQEPEEDPGKLYLAQVARYKRLWRSLENRWATSEDFQALGVWKLENSTLAPKLSSEQRSKIAYMETELGERMQAKPEPKKTA